jgi:uncharacterized protein YebE (UPF0316 family)
MIWVMIFLLKAIELTIESLRLLIYLDGRRALGSLLSIVDAILGVAAAGCVIYNITCWQGYLAFGLGYGAGNWAGSALYDRYK